MDLGSAYQQAGITSSIIALMGISYKVYTAVNHKRCRSKCCGYNIENSLDIGDTTPEVRIPAETFSNPMVDVKSVCPKPTTQN